MTMMRTYSEKVSSLFQWDEQNFFHPNSLNIKKRRRRRRKRLKILFLYFSSSFARALSLSLSFNINCLLLNRSWINVAKNAHSMWRHLYMSVAEKIDVTWMWSVHYDDKSRVSSFLFSTIQITLVPIQLNIQ